MDSVTLAGWADQSVAAEELGRLREFVAGCTGAWVGGEMSCSS